MATFHFINWSGSSTSASTPTPALTQRTFVPGRLRLSVSTTSNNDHLWAAARASFAARAMDPPRPKRIRARVSYVEPTELDDDIADDEPAAPALASEDHVSETELDATEIESESDSDDEFTTDKRKLKAQKKKKAAKKAAKKVKKIKDVPFPFMELPLEIRYMIYKECLVESARDLSFASKSSGRDLFRGTMKRTNHRSYGYNWKVKRERASESNRTTLQPVILRLNKAVRDEAIHHLYTQTFHFATTHAFQQWFMRVSPTNRLLIRSVVIKGWTDYRFARTRDVQHVFSLLTSAINVRSILLDRHVWSETDGPALSYRNVSFTNNAYNFWRDIQYWAGAIDAAHGKGTAKATLKFTKLCFGSVKEIEQEEEVVEEREQEFMADLKFSEKAKKVEKVEKAEEAEAAEQ